MFWYEAEQPLIYSCIGCGKAIADGGYCRACKAERAEEAKHAEHLRHLAEFDRWEAMSDREREDEIKRAT